jgi:hypothetical protein
MARSGDGGAVSTVTLDGLAVVPANRESRTCCRLLGLAISEIQIFKLTFEKQDRISSFLKMMKY